MADQHKRKTAAPQGRASRAETPRSLTAEELADRLEQGSKEPKLTHEEVFGHPMPRVQ